MVGRSLAGGLIYSHCNALSARTSTSTIRSGFQLNPGTWLSLPGAHPLQGDWRRQSSCPVARPLLPAPLHPPAFLLPGAGPGRRLKDQTESGTSESPLCRKTWVCNYSNIIICFMLPKMSVTGCWSICAVGDCFCCPSGRARLSWHFQGPSRPFPGKAVAVEWETRPTVLRKNTLGKSSFSHTEEAEAGSQRKVNSKINENREVEEKNQKLPIKPSKMWGREKGSENKGRPKLCEH